MRPIHRRFSAGPLLALALVAPAHAAQGVNLSWSRCHGEAGGTQNRAFACDTNTGAEHLVASFVLPTDLPQYRAARMPGSGIAPLLRAHLRFHAQEVDGE